jgi:hypothetical protein
MKTTPEKTKRSAGHARAEEAPRPRRAAASGQPLSTLQKARLCQDATAAFAHQEKMGLVEVRATESRSKAMETWRRAELAAAGFPASLRECNNYQFRGIRAHFLMLAGKDDVAFGYHMKSGRVKDKGAAEDTYERREEIRALILKALLEHGARVNPAHKDFDEEVAATVTAKGGMIEAGYVIAIAKAKAKGRELDSLTASELWQVLYTVRNRIAAREGRGTTGGRNKSQRRKAKKS